MRSKQLRAAKKAGVRPRLEAELRAAPVAALGVPADLVVRAHADPLGDGAVLLHLLRLRGNERVSDVRPSASECAPLGAEPTAASASRQGTRAGRRPGAGLGPASAPRRPPAERFRSKYVGPGSGPLPWNGIGLGGAPESASCGTSCGKAARGGRAVSAERGAARRREGLGGALSRKRVSGDGVTVQRFATVVGSPVEGSAAAERRSLDVRGVVEGAHHRVAELEVESLASRPGVDEVSMAETGRRRRVRPRDVGGPPMMEPRVAATRPGAIMASWRRMPSRSGDGEDVVPVIRAGPCEPPSDSDPEARSAPRPPPPRVSLVA